MQDARAVVAHCGDGFDQEMGPLRVVRVVGEVDLCERAECRKKEVSLRRCRYRPDTVPPCFEREWLDPVGAGLRKVVVCVRAVTHREESFAELAEVKRAAAARGDRTKRASDAFAAGESAGVGGLAGEAGEAGRVLLVHQRERTSQQRRDGEAVLGETNRRGEDRGQRQRAEALVQGDPPRYGAGHSDGADVAVERHLAVAFVAQLLGAHARAGPTRGVERVNRAVHVHQRKEIAADTAEVRRHDGHRGIRGQRGVDGVAAERKHVGTGLGGCAVRARDDAEPRVRAGGHVVGASVA